MEPTQANYPVFMKLRKLFPLQEWLCSGWAFAQTAEGNMDGMIALNPFGHWWDYAAGSLLVAEAGGRVTNIGSPDYTINNLNFIAAGPQVFRSLVEGPEPILPIWDSRQGARHPGRDHGPHSFGGADSREYRSGRRQVFPERIGLSAPAPKAE